MAEKIKEKKAADKAASEKKVAKAKLKSANKLSAATEKVKVMPIKSFIDKYTKIGSAASLKKATLLGLIQPKQKKAVSSEKNKDTKSSKSVKSAKSQSKEKGSISKLVFYKETAVSKKSVKDSKRDTPIPEIKVKAEKKLTLGFSTISSKEIAKSAKSLTGKKRLASEMTK